MSVSTQEHEARRFTMVASGRFSHPRYSKGTGFLLRFFSPPDLTSPPLPIPFINLPRPAGAFMEYRLIELCCMAIDRFVHAHRTTGYGAGVSRRFRSNVLWKQAREYIRAMSPTGEVAKAIDQVNELPEAEKKAVLQEVLGRAERKATELNETATEPIGARPMHRFASYVLGANQAHLEQSSPLSGTAAPDLQFAFYKPSSSSPTPNTNTEPSPSPSAVGPIRRERQRRKPTGPGRLSRCNGDSMVERPGSVAVDMQKMAEENLNFQSSLYSVQNSSSASRQGTSTLVPPQAHSQLSEIGLPHSAQGSYSTSFTSNWENPPSTSFSYPPHSTPTLEAPVLDHQQQQSGKIKTVGLGDPFGRVGLSNEFQWFLAQGTSNLSSQPPSVYHTPSSTLTRRLELNEDIELPQFSHDVNTHNALGLGSFDPARLAPLSEMPMMDFEFQDYSDPWSSALPEAYQNVMNIPSVDYDLTQTSSNGFAFINPRQNHGQREGQDQGHHIQTSGPLSYQDPTERRASAQWCESVRAQRENRRPESVSYWPPHQQILDDTEQHRTNAQRRGTYQQPNIVPPYGFPPMSSVTGNSNVIGLGVEDQTWAERPSDAWNVSSNATSTLPNATLQNPHLNPAPYSNQSLDHYTYQDSGTSSRISSETGVHMDRDRPRIVNLFADDPETPVMDLQPYDAPVYGRAKAHTLRTRNGLGPLSNASASSPAGGPLPQGIEVSIAPGTEPSIYNTHPRTNESSIQHALDIEPNGY